jgi:CxxC-x17-CxxC domain-containing protein
MIDGVASAPFSASTLPPIANPSASRERVIKVSRERYAEPRQVIEEKIMRWAGFETPEEKVSGEIPPAATEVTSVPQGEAKREIKKSDSRRRSRVQIVVNCSNCGREVSVGFKPDPNRPFYCEECFKKVKADREAKKPRA